MAGTGSRSVIGWVPGGFVGCVFALYASSHGQESNSVATFHNIEYSGKNDDYIMK
jgi:hypothetical protein